MNIEQIIRDIWIVLQKIPFGNFTPEQGEAWDRLKEALDNKNEVTPPEEG